MPPQNKKRKWIVVTGGVVSGLGKGTTTASIGSLMKDKRKIITIKCDGYLNVDPGTMNPFEHGEVFVLDDGGEVDLDFGHYERFLDINCKFEWNLTSGKIFKSVIDKERRGDYLGKTIQIFPHISDEVKRRFYAIAEKEKADIVMIEIGGTIGDHENAWFIEAARQLRKEVGRENITYVHLTYVPFLDSVGELKSKPAQRDIALLRTMGINPEIVIMRSKKELPQKLKEKVALFADLEPEQIISGQDVDTIYEIPLNYEKQGMSKFIHQKFGIKPNTEKWKKLVQRIKNPKKKIRIAIAGKYTELADSYISISEALTHAGAHLDAKIEIGMIETTNIETERDAERKMSSFSGIIVPGGFGGRGVEGKIKVIEYARKNKIPFLGLCYGLQLAVIEFARHVCNLESANTTENDLKTKYPVIDILPEQKNVTEKGATMRLGMYKAILKKGTRAHRLYNSEIVYERHRHRYEVNPIFHKVLLEHGLVFSGTSENGRLVEFIELNNHPYFVATQAHPEFKSRLIRPAPLFFGFVDACLRK
jgi:CTP synthase